MGLKDKSRIGSMVLGFICDLYNTVRVGDVSMLFVDLYGLT